MPRTDKPKLTRVDQLLGRIQSLLREGAYKVGQRLPSIREAAEEQGVSKNTMAEAYDRLVAQGLLEARVGSGFYVLHVDVPRSVPPQPHIAEAVDLVSLLREQLDQHYDLRPGDGRPPASWMEGSELRHHFSRFKMSTRASVDFGYGSSRGFGPLRERIRIMLLDRSITVPSDGVLLTHGANHALDLIIRHLLEPGDTVFVDDPGYYPLFGKLALARAQVVGIRRLADGPDLEDLAEKLTKFHPKLFFTQSQAHNPTGSTLSPAIAFGLLRFAERFDFRLVEDDAFADVLPQSLARLAALDQLDRVLYVGSFSKTLSASLRCGFVVAHPTLIGHLSDLKMVTTVATSDYIERVVFFLIQGGHYLRHLRRLRRRLEEANRQALTHLSNVGLHVSPSKVPGFYLWVELPSHINEQELCHAAAAESIFLAPGQVFHPNRIPGRSAATRINVAYAADERLIDFFRRSIGGSRSTRKFSRSQK